MKTNNDIVNTLKQTNRVAIFIHTNPDGDCLGAASALKQALVLLNKSVDIFSDSVVSENYNFIKYIKDIRYDENVEGFDLHVALDCSDLKRLAKYDKYFNKIENTIMIDHHKTSEQFAKLCHVESSMSSACLILYYYVQQLCPINKEIAEALYAGISSDTGCFIHSNTTSLEHKVAAELIEYGFDLDNANQMLFKYTTLAKFELNKRALAGAEFFADGKIGLLKLTKKDLIETKADISDTTGLVNQITNVNCCEIGAIIYEEQRGLFRCSLRSKNDIDVSLIAKEFGGGGHAKASGCNIFGCLNTVKNKLITVSEKYLK